MVRNLCIAMVLFLVPVGSAVAALPAIELKHRTVFAEKPIAGVPILNPQAIETDDAGNLYIVDTGNNRIIKLDENGLLVVLIGGFGWEKEQFDTPLDATIKRGLDLYVVDYNNERIERYDRRMNYISSYVKDDQLPESLRFGFPVSIDVSRHGELFICEHENNRILKLDAFGAPSLSFGDFNEGEGQLERPVHLEIAADDMVYVSDQSKDQIFVFDYYGNFVVRFGEDRLDDPSGLCWLGNQYLFVADTGNRRIVAYDKRLHEAASWRADESIATGFHAPVDVAVSNQQLFVLDSDLAEIHVFDILMK